LTYAYLDEAVVTVILSCEADGFPHPVIGWLNSNLSVTNGTAVQNGSVSTLTLVFTETKEQLQKYRCVAINSIGSTLSKEVTVPIPIPGKKLYYMEENVLLGTKPLVDSKRHFIRDPSGVFSVCHLCELVSFNDVTISALCFC